MSWGADAPVLPDRRIGLARPLHLAGQGFELCRAAVEVGAVRGHDPCLFLFGGAHTAAADPLHGVFLDLPDTRVSGNTR
jgi:hypothetical protein